MRVTTACSVTNAMIRISPPPLGHTSTSTANTRRSPECDHASIELAASSSIQPSRTNSAGPGAPPRLGEHGRVVRALRHEAAVTTEGAIGDDKVQMRMPVGQQTEALRQAHHARHCVRIGLKLTGPC